MASSLSLILNTMFSLMFLEIYLMQYSFAVCLPRSMNCGFMISLSMNIIWIFSKFFYAWFGIFVFLFELSVWFGQLDWLLLQWERCLALGSILRDFTQWQSRGSETRIELLPSRIKDGVYITLHEFIPLHHVIFLKALLCSYELNTLDACWIAVDVWSNSSRCRIVSVYLTRTWCLYCIIIALDIVITLRFSINCSAVIC